MNVAVLMAQAPAGQQQHPAAAGANNRGFPSANQPPSGPANAEAAEPTPEEIDSARTREISVKAVSGILLLLLKWLKVSRTCCPLFSFRCPDETAASLTRDRCSQI